MPLLLARIAAGVVTSGQWFRPAEQGLTGRAPYGRRVGILAWGESRSQIRAGLMLSKIHQMCCVVSSFPPTQHNYQLNITPEGVRWSEPAPTNALTLDRMAYDNELQELRGFWGEYHTMRWQGGISGKRQR